MKRKDEVQLAKAQTAKISRTLIRLRHSLAADVEINAVIPDKLDEIDNAAGGGSSYSLDVVGLAEEILGDPS